jgi:hypothetical protein
MRFPTFAAGSIDGNLPYLVSSHNHMKQSPGFIQPSLARRRIHHAILFSSIEQQDEVNLVGCPRSSSEGNQKPDMVIDYMSIPDTAPEFLDPEQLNNYRTEPSKASKNSRLQQIPASLIPPPNIQRLC